MPAAAPTATGDSGITDDLSQGFVVETAILARLLGIKLLTLEGVVYVSPPVLARLKTAAATSSGATTLRVRSNGHSASGTSGPSVPITADVDGHVGARLLAAAALLDENGRQLAGLNGQVH